MIINQEEEEEEEEEDEEIGAADETRYHGDDPLMQTSDTSSFQGEGLTPIAHALDICFFLARLCHANYC